MTGAELREQARVIYHNADLNTFGTRNAREALLVKPPVGRARDRAVRASERGLSRTAEVLVDPTLQVPRNVPPPSPSHRSSALA
jgi:hypothetical protein